MLDAAVDDLAKRFRRALDPPGRVGAPIDAVTLRQDLQGAQ